MVVIVGGHGIVGSELETLLRNRGVTSILKVGRGDTLPKSSVYFLTAGKEASKKLIPQIPADALVIDLSSAHRAEFPLILPEANGYLLESFPKRIATPNCVVSILLTVLAPLHKKYGIESIYLSTYQAASGAGKVGLKALSSPEAIDPFPHCFPENVFLHEAAADEEEKIIFETRSLLNHPSLKIGVRSVRVPVKRAHSISAFVTFKQSPNFEGLELPGVIQHPSPTPILAEGKEEVYLAPIREIGPNQFDFWIVGDQLLKGAALTAVQIYKTLMTNRELNNPIL